MEQRIIDVPAGTAVPLREMQEASKVIIGGRTVKNRNGRCSQLVAVAFAEGSRAYTYHNDGEPVAVGDRVIIPMRGGGSKVVCVTALPTESPPFETKPILGPAPPAEGETTAEKEE